MVKTVFAEMCDRFAEFLECCSFLRRCARAENLAVGSVAGAPATPAANRQRPPSGKWPYTALPGRFACCVASQYRLQACLGQVLGLRRLEACMDVQEDGTHGHALTRDTPHLPSGVPRQIPQPRGPLWPCRVPHACKGCSGWSIYMAAPRDGACLALQCAFLVVARHHHAQAGLPTQRSLAA
jgi:hypothetical protein